jgi:predicted MPP superfamily phosphohydrolase
MKRGAPILFVFLFILIALVEYYSYSTIRFATRNLKVNYKTIIITSYILLCVLWYSIFLFFPQIRTNDFNKTFRNIIISFSMGFLLMKVVMASVLLIDDLRRLVTSVISLFYSSSKIPAKVINGMSRADFMYSLSLLLGGTFFATMLYGMSNRYKYKIRNVSIKFPTLPPSFNGLKIVQISDVHSGSFSNIEAVQLGIDMINAQKPDVVFFTGDLVNNKADEMTNYISVFKKINAPMGVFSIFGNHDYGDYITWESEDAKQQNLQDLKNIHGELGWRLLLNEHITLEKNNEKIAVIGVENIASKGRFHSYGDMQKAYTGSEQYPFKILLSHDPSHWDGEVNKNYKDVNLTLAGHTHGMQFGIEIPGFIKWSPVKYMYKRWAGLYTEGEQHIYVNRGFGFLGYPGRVGILPEISVITLTV